MSESLYRCEACDKTIQLRNRKRHDQSKYHKNRQPRLQPQLPEDCTICLETLSEPAICIQCQQSWCSSCDKNIFKCPFCRLQIKGRETESRQFESTLLNDYGLLMMNDETDLVTIVRQITGFQILGYLLQRIID